MTGNTIFNVTKMGDCDTDSSDRPIFPPKITGCEVLLCPFDDIVPRQSKRERAEELRLEREAAELAARRARKKSAKKNMSLISFGEEAEEDEAEMAAATAFKGKPLHSRLHITARRRAAACHHLAEPFAEPFAVPATSVARERRNKAF